jgi:ABC-type transport system involved in multi-copper enzyme maturation permease subunit
VTAQTPAATSALTLFASLSIRRIRRGGQLWISAVLLGLIMIASLAALIGGKSGVDVYQTLSDLMLRYLIPFIMALHASAVVAEEVQAKTITYLFCRPIARWTLPLGKYLGHILIGLALILPATLVIFLTNVIGASDEFDSIWSSLGQLILSTSLATLLFGAIAVAFGTMITSYSFVGALLYLLVVEVGLALVPGWLKAVAMTVHLLNLAGLYFPKDSMWMPDPVLPWWASLAAVLVETVLWLVIAASWVNGAEYRTSSQPG